MKKCQISMLVLIISLFTSSISVFAGARQIEPLSDTELRHPIQRQVICRK